jgi:hypothetical protein
VAEASCGLRSHDTKDRTSRFDFSSDFCLTEGVQSDPLLHLFGGSDGIDFLSSTKRGSFKSKYRWTSLAS